MAIRRQLSFLHQALPMREAPTSRSFFLASAAVILALAGTVWLWAYFSTTIFFETIRAGFIACFG